MYVSLSLTLIMHGSIIEQLTSSFSVHFLLPKYRNFPLLGAYAYSSTGRKWALMFETMLNNE